MTDVPLRSISISDFRRLNGTRTLPLDAPIVLIHGSNGAGKTSVLSALELGLTGQIRSLQRQDPRYIAHLPTLGQDFATIRVEVSQSYTDNDGPTVPLTAGGSRIEGIPALTPEVANFYGERCYLDQASLGRLLELYQHREGKQESALAQFVNELLGLEQLDALRTGLSAANDLRSLKKLADRLEDAANRADRAAADLTETSRNLAEARAEVGRTRMAAQAAALSLGVLDAPVFPTTDGTRAPTDKDEDEGLIGAILRTVADQDLDTEHTRLLSLQRDLITLGGRLDAAAARPSTHDLTDARDQLGQAQQRFKLWSTNDGSDIQAWQRAARKAGVVLDSDHGADIDRALNEVQRLLSSQRLLQAEREATELQLEADQRLLDSLQERLLDAQEHATALVEGLAFIRPILVTDICPVCDRDYAELGSGHLGAHVDAKIAQLSQQGQRLLDLRRERDALLSTVMRSQADLERTTVALLGNAQARVVEERGAELARLHDGWQALRPAVAAGRDLRTAEMQAQRRVELLEAASDEEQFARAELARCADALGISVPESSVRAAWEILSDAVGSRLGEIGQRAAAQHDGTAAVEQMEQALRRQADAIALVADAAHHKSEWEACVKEGRRRQAVARAVFDAATEVRTNVVQRVFTQSLNRVWMSLFSRLAPNEGFIPSFGIPTASKTGLELTLRTVHRDGQEGGTPQMMLSAGNLNTAALSLFLALHLAVDPVIPCLVFDDPVQAMDEVHVAQFAGLIRVLAKQHERQIVIAVHERELFDYLTLELSPAYEGDELLTIELGGELLAPDDGVTRHVWTPDSAIAG